MKQIRLLPVVVVAASALLGLKAIGIATGSGYTLGGGGAAYAAGAPVEAGGGETSQIEEPAGTPVPAAGAGDTILGTVPSSDGLPTEAELVDIMGGGSDSGATQDLILQRLAERRAELDAFAAELETRLAVVEAAELRIEERMAELSALEAQINTTLDAADAEGEAQFAAIVSMYEAMRPADAATIFNDLETQVLVRVGVQMNPRKLGPIMAKMVPAKAQELTVLLAQNGQREAQTAASPDLSQLPQIVGQ